MPQRAVRTRTLLSVPPLLQPPGSPGRRVIAGPGSSGTWRAPGPMPRLGQCGGLGDSRHAGVCGHRLARGAGGEGCSGAACRRGAAPAPRRGRSQSSEHQHGLAAQDAQAAACQAREASVTGLEQPARASPGVQLAIPGSGHRAAPGPVRGVEKGAMSQGMQAVAPKRHPMRPGSGLTVKTAAAQGGVWASAAFRWDPHG